MLSILQQIITMKNNLRYFLILPAILFIASCGVKVTSRPVGHLPPGQAKKITGSQSARPYAPGQQKN
jgi:hypothetical protein